MKNKINTQSNSKIAQPSGVSAMQWVAALLNASKASPAAQAHYEPVGDRRRRMEVNRELKAIGWPYALPKGVTLGEFKATLAKAAKAQAGKK